MKRLRELGSFVISVRSTEKAPSDVSGSSVLHPEIHMLHITNAVNIFLAVVIMGYPHQRAIRLADSYRICNCFRGLL